MLPTLSCCGQSLLVTGAVPVNAPRQELTRHLPERRKARCEQELGQGIVALHLHAAAGAHTAASFWVGLLRASHLMEDVCWWSEGAAALTSSYSQARAL